MNKNDKPEKQSDSKSDKDQVLAKLNESAKDKPSIYKSSEKSESESDTDESTGAAFNVNGPAEKKSDD